MRPVSIHNAHPKLRFPQRLAAQIIRTLDGNSTRFISAPPDGEISIAILTDPEITRIHALHLDDPTPTDVITYPADPTALAPAQIYISADTAIAYAKKHKLPPARELILYLVHGWLHLAGYDDLEPKKKRLMRAAEKRALSILQQQKLLPKTLP